jgi:hypothetical protein
MRAAFSRVPAPKDISPAHAGQGGVQSTGRSGIFARELTRHLFYERPKP